jgi:hypothetical protein
MSKKQAAILGTLIMVILLILSSGSGSMAGILSAAFVAVFLAARSKRER